MRILHRLCNRRVIPSRHQFVVLNIITFFVTIIEYRIHISVYVLYIIHADMKIYIKN